MDREYRRDDVKSVASDISADEYGLTACHDAELKMLKAIDFVCTQLGIDFVLDSGTLLGAVRHRGFIPWDDDVDVAMRRKDWEIFRKEAPGLLPDSMELVTPGMLGREGLFYDFTPRLIYKKSHRISRDCEKGFFGERLNHIWVDIFIMDRISDSAFGARRAIAGQKFLYGLAMGHRNKLNWKKYTMLQKAGVTVLSLTGKLIPMERIAEMQEKFSAYDADRETKQYYYSNYDPSWLYIRVPAESAEVSIRMPFEDTCLPVPADYDRILALYYGDYMTPPEASARIPEHGSKEIIFDD